MNNKGFTLVELIATIVVLALVMGLASYSIVGIIKRSKEKNYELLVTNIKDAAETYYQECRYAKNSAISCYPNDNTYTITLGNLVEYGYLKGNSKDSDDKYTLVNPLDDVDISECIIQIRYNNGKINVSDVDHVLDSCPMDYNK